MMTKACLALAFFCLGMVLSAQAFTWETANSRGREYVTLRSFCDFYHFSYASPSGNDRFTSRSTTGHTISLKSGNSDLYLDGVHYVMSFPIESGDNDWLVSRMDVIKLFEPLLRPQEISGRHTIRGVVLDPGHGGTDNGAQSRYGAEKNYAKDTAFRVEELLRDAGLKTVMTRRTDVFVDLYERAHIASLYPDYCFVSMHFNSATAEAHGLETYCLAPRGAASTSSNYLSRSDIQKLPGNDDDSANILLASMVHSEIIKLNPGDQSADRGVKRARFVVIKANLLPAILVEGGFVSNPIEARRIDTSAYRQALAQAITRGILKFINAMSGRNYSLPSGNGGGVASGDDDDDAKPAPRATAVANPAPTGLAANGSGKKPAADAATTPAKTTSSSSGDKKKPGATSSTTISAKSDTPAKTASSSNATTSKSKKGKKPAAADATASNKPATTPAPAATPASAPAETNAPAATPPEATATTQQPAPAPAPEADNKPASDNKATSDNKNTPPPVIHVSDEDNSKSSSTTPHNPLNLSEPIPPAPPAGADKAPPEPDEPPVNIYPTSKPDKAPAEAPASKGANEGTNAAPQEPQP